MIDYLEQDNPFGDRFWNPTAPRLDPSGDYVSVAAPQFEADTTKTPPSTPPSGPVIGTPGGEGFDPPPGFQLPAGVSLEQARDFIARNPGDYHRIASAITPTSDRMYDSQSAEGNRLYGSGSGNATNRPGGRVSSPFANPNPQFGDPSSRLVEDYALDRFRQRQTPDPNSGTALYESYLKKYFDTLQGAPYSPTEESQIKQTAYNAIEQERAATKQRWLEEVSRRGILPSSGIALEGLKAIDNHYGQIRAEADNSFANQAIGLTRANRAQAAGVAGSLASNEEERLSDALSYAMLPLSLQDRSFNQGLALIGAGGNPGNLSSSALGVLNMLQQANQVNSANRSQFTQGLLQYLGYLFGGR